ncbi:MAG: hypothetical protein K9H25_23420 [Rhodospirillum sp.]|nr:hypothetical protein [Rhodospirillum sp.]MCF8492016.1 hypothetical protein [Rhodospirillum sp.]MCF8502190.1 hypothetical protein [Rhodospirillum sp.]
MNRLIILRKPVRTALILATLLAQLFALDDGFALGRRTEREHESPRRERSESSKGKLEQRQREHETGKERDGDSKYHNYRQAPKALPAFPDTYRVPSKSRNRAGKLRPRWKDSDGKIYEWDFQHGRVERYSKRGKHEGEFDLNTGRRTKPAKKNRTVEP